MHKRYLSIIVVVSVLANLWLAWQVLAGSPDSPDFPEMTNTYTLEDLYQRLNVGIAGTQSTFTEPNTAPGIMHTINEIMDVTPAMDNTNGAIATNVLSDRTFWGLTSGQWGITTGTMPNNGVGSTIVPTTTNQSIAAGYWASANTVQGDSDLVVGNIKSGVNVFGVDGTLTEGNTYYAGVPKTGQTTSYATGDDGDLERGVAWPSPRFTDSGDGTVVDNLTSLIWLKNANCFGTRNWATALMDANGLANGSCNLSDGSSAGDWHLPNVKELQSLIDHGRWNPALPSGHPFINVQSGTYWSGSTYADSTSYAWIVYGLDGIVDGGDKTFTRYVWPVRSEQ